jgi:hypothetical protein
LSKKKEPKEEENKKKKKVGRPSKKDIESNKRGNRVARGRPKGDAAVINEYKARMLASPKSRKVLDAIFDAALNDEHKNQAAAWKLVMDRIAPTAVFEQEVLKSGGKSAITINITGVGEVKQEPDALDGEWSPVDE